MKLPRQKLKILSLLILAGAVSAYYLLYRHPPLNNRDNELSIFDQLIAQNHGVIPYPFDKLLNYLHSKSQLEMRDPVIVALVPQGRSLHRDKTSFKEPRIIAALGDQYPIFIGYVPVIDELEIISFNPGTARYDFELVDGYKEGGHPKTKAASQDLCFQCHQSGMPIFPRSSWREMREMKAGYVDKFFKKYGYTSNIPSHHKDVNLLGLAVLKARDNERFYHGVDLDDYAYKEDGYHGSFLRSPAASYAFFLRLANWSVQKHRVMKEVCGHDLDCRWQILKRALLFPSLTFIALNKGLDKARPLIDEHVAVLEKILGKYWPQGEFSYVSPVLPDRRVLNQKEPTGFLIRPLVNGEDLTYYEMLGDFIPPEFYYLARLHFDYLNKFPLSRFHEVPTRDPKILDPMTPRPLVNRVPLKDAGYFVLSNGLEGVNFSRFDIHVLQALDYEKLKEVLEKRKYRSFVYTWPPDAHKVIATILTDMGNEKEAEPYKLAIHNFEEYQKVGQTTYPADDKSSANSFVKYCGACHTKENPMMHEKDVLPLESLEELSQIPSVCTQISEGRMPPRKYHLQPTQLERGQMLESLRCP